HAAAGAVGPHLDDVRDGAHLADLGHDRRVVVGRAVALGGVEEEAALVEARAQRGLDRGRLLRREQVPRLHDLPRVREHEPQRLRLAEQDRRAVLRGGGREQQRRGEEQASHVRPQKYVAAENSGVLSSFWPASGAEPLLNWYPSWYPAWFAVG